MRSILFENAFICKKLRRVSKRLRSGGNKIGDWEGDYGTGLHK